MKKLAPLLTVLLFLTAGCGATQPGNNTGGNQAAQNAANNTAGPLNEVTTGNGTTGNVAGEGGPLPSQSFMQKTAQTLVTRYVDSHNDKTLAAYKKDARQIFEAGFANLFLPMVSSGVDYNHPVQSSKVQILSVNALSSQVFVAMTHLQIHYKHEAVKDYNYVFQFVKDHGRWYINKIT
ncbi:MAG: hypothetical protein K6T83_09805 [Alicyclobacillus sp.]|nr:hypothetical protein [Alicyclobacillus sp.]